MSQRLVRLCPGRRLLEDSAASRKNAVLLSQPPASIITLKTCRNNSLCRIRFDVGFEIIEAKRMGTLLRTHHDTLPGRVLNMSTHRPSSSVSAQTEELPCHKPPHLSKSQILCCLSVNRTPIGSKELTTVHGTPGMSTHWPLSSLMHSRPTLIR